MFFSTKKSVYCQAKYLTALTSIHMFVLGRYFYNTASSKNRRCEEPKVKLEFTTQCFKTSSRVVVLLVAILAMKLEDPASRGVV